MIQSIQNNQNILKPQMQNTSLEQLVNQLNASVANKQNFDVLELSKEALALLKENNEAKENEKSPTINFENSEIIHSNKWGLHSKAEYAEMSLNSQRNDLKTISDQLDYHKSKLEFTTQKISELENYINGSASHSDSNMTIETAETYLHNYKQSIINDYANITMGKNQYHADELDKLSGGMASAVYENQLHTLNEGTLGLENLSADPKEIMKALENASNIIDEMTADLEFAFADATGGTGFQEPAKSQSIFGSESSLTFFESQMETGYKTINVKGIDVNGETLKLDISSISDLEVAHIEK